MAEFITLGWQLGSWVETLLCYPPGDVEGKPIELNEEELAVIARCYQLHAITGRRQVFWYLLSRAKGWTKSTLASFIVCAEAKGPVRFHHWAKRGETSWWGYEYTAGEPVGAPVKSPFIRCLATEETQTGNTYGNVEFILENARIAEELAGDDVGKTGTYIAGGGEIRPSTGGDVSKDGGNETFVVEDEPHLYVLPVLRSMHNTVMRNLPKRKAAQPWMLATSTMCLPGAGSIYEDALTAHETGRAIVGFRFDHREGGPVKKTDSDAKLKREMARALGANAARADLDARITQARLPTTDWFDVERYNLNRKPTLANVGWLKEHPGAWERCFSKLQIPIGAIVAAGVDSALNRDHAAIVIASRVADRVVVRSQEFVPGANGRIDRAPMKNLLRWIALNYELRGVQYDPKYFEDSAQELEDDSILMLDNWQSPERMVPACGHLLELIVGGELAHDGDPILTAHVMRAHKRQLDTGFRLSKGKSPGPIDCCIALAMAVAELDLSDPPPAKPQVLGDFDEDEVARLVAQFEEDDARAVADAEAQDEAARRRRRRPRPSQEDS